IHISHAKPLVAAPCMINSSSRTFSCSDAAEGEVFGLTAGDEPSELLVSSTAVILAEASIPIKIAAPTIVAAMRLVVSVCITLIAGCFDIFEAMQEIHRNRCSRVGQRSILRDTSR